MKTLSDEIIAGLLGKGDENAYKEIYDRYWRQLLSMAIYKTNDRDIAEEIVQELFVSIWEKRNTTQIQNLENYLFVSLKYLIIAHLKKVIAARNISSIENIEIPKQPTETLTVETLQNAINQAVEQLPHKTQAVFKMSRFEEKSHKEIADNFEITEKAVEYHISQALKHLRHELKEYLM